jgi:hypothetical protein
MIRYVRMDDTHGLFDVKGLSKIQIFNLKEPCANPV